MLRGALAEPLATEGRYCPVILGLSEARADVTLGSDDIAAITAALRQPQARVGVSGLGVIERGEVRTGALAGYVAVVTGGASGLGLAIAQALHARGATLVLLDIAPQVEKVALDMAGLGLLCDMTDATAVDAAIARVVASFGGVDILISNAGAAQQGALLELDDADFSRAFALNFWGHHYAARAVVRVMKAQGTGGALVFNVSKQAVNPGQDFGAYGTSKAALMALMRQYAVEHGQDGISANAVNADRIRTGLMTEAMVIERSKARGVTPEAYMRGNLLKREVSAEDVANAFVYLAQARTTTGAVITVDGGNVAAMMR